MPARIVLFFYVINVHQMNVKILIGQYSKHANHSLYTCAMARTIAILDPPHRLKIPDLNTCLILLPQIQLSGCFELKLHC